MSNVSEVVEYLSAAKIFSFSSVDGIKPKVRPFGFAMEYNGSIYFTSNYKRPVCKELKENPNFEVTAIHPDKQYHWIRFSGEAVFDADYKVKAKAFELTPELKSYYQTPDHPDFAMFRAKNGEAVIYEGMERRTIQL